MVAGIRKYISEVIVNRFTFLESKRNTVPEPVEPYQPATVPSNPTSSYGYSESEDTYRTATTMAWGLNHHMNTIDISDDDLPF